MSNSKSATMVGALALLTAALAGCSGSKQSDTQSTSATASQPPAAQPTTAAAQPAASATADVLAQPQSAATIAAAASNPVVASTDGDQPGTKLVVNALARGSDTVTLKFTLVNDSATAVATYEKFHGSGYGGNHRDVSGVHLIDTVSKKKYFALADTDGICVCSQDVGDLLTKTQTALWVKFPAPPPNVMKITVEAPHFLPLENVPISQ